MIIPVIPLCIRSDQIPCNTPTRYSSYRVGKVVLDNRHVTLPSPRFGCRRPADDNTQPPKAALVAGYSWRFDGKVQSFPLRAFAARLYVSRYNFPKGRPVLHRNNLCRWPAGRERCCRLRGLEKTPAVITAQACSSLIASLWAKAVISDPFVSIIRRTSLRGTNMRPTGVGFGMLPHTRLITTSSRLAAIEST